jgi:hypothetical protein
MNQSIVRLNIARALGEWAQHTVLNFQEVSVVSEADIKISFANGDHWDRYPFDKKGGVLGHAFYPPDGRVHLDFDEDWDEPMLFRTLLHEFGHTLGLAHTTNVTTTNIMSPYYSEQNNRLGEDDIAGIKFIYGEKPKVIPPTILPNIKPKIYFNVIPGTQIPRIMPRVQILGIPGTQIPRIMPRVQIHGIPGTQIPRIMPRVQIHGIPGTQIPRIMPRVVSPVRLIQNFFFILDGNLNLTFKDNGIR